MGRWLALGAALILLLIVLGRCLAPPPIAPFLTGEVRRGDLELAVSATGNLAPTDQIDVGSETSGIVERVLVEVNDKVVKGQPLAALDASRLKDAVTRSQSSLLASQAAVIQARATLSEAQAQLDRLREVSRLSGGRVPAATELASQVAAADRARASLASAEANVVSAQAQLSSDRTQLSKAVIRSPVTGVVLKRTIDPGQTVQAAFTAPSLFIIAKDLRRMKLEVSVDEADIARVREGQTASFQVDAYPGRRFPASISRVNLGAKNLSGGSASGSTSGSVVSYVANLVVANDDLTLRPGMTATATIHTSAIRNALVVPNAALRFTPPAPPGPGRSAFAIRPPATGQAQPVQERGIGPGSRQTVYAPEPGGHLHAIVVTTGESDGRETVVFGEGLSPGMKLVTGQRAAPGHG